ncbi:MAG: glycine zipper 2TM domain-containing protein [Sphingomonadaceae bacterium]|nr:glycine zipper 2TM domain-containing protein [Sphingomonadaceae bacterium]
MRTQILSMAAIAMAATAGPALAAPPAHAPAWGHRAQEAQYQQIAMLDRRDRRRGYNGRIWRDDRGRYRCRRDDGTVGLIVGGGVGALLGREIDGGRDRTVGTVVGAAAGALLGREIDRSDARCD